MTSSSRPIKNHSTPYGKNFSLPVSDTPSVNIAHLDSWSASGDDEGSLEDDEESLENVVARIGSELETYPEIVAEISAHLDSDSAVPLVESDDSPRHDADSHIQSKVSSGDIVPFSRSSDGQLCYSRCQDVTLVPTKSVVEDLPSYLDGSDDMLTDDFLESVAHDIDILADEEYPKVSFLVPAEYVVENAASTSGPCDFSRKLLQLSHADNAEYESEPASSSGPSSLMGVQSRLESAEDTLLSWDDYAALCLAMGRESAHLLLPESDGQTWKFTQLFGVDTTTLSSEGR